MTTPQEKASLKREKKANRKGASAYARANTQEGYDESRAGWSEAKRAQPRLIWEREAIKEKEREERAKRWEDTKKKQRIKFATIKAKAVNQEVKGAVRRNPRRRTDG